MKPHFTLSSVFPKPKDVIQSEDKCGVVYEIPCNDCNFVYIGETGRSLKTRKKEHANAVKSNVIKQSALVQHVIDHDHTINWQNTKILKSERNIFKRRFAESFLINQKSKKCDVINRNDGLSMPPVYKILL